MGLYRALAGYGNTRANYWADSKLAKWIRSFGDGPARPKWATMEEWDQWENEWKEKSPFIDWLSDDAFDFIQDVVYFPYDVYRNFRYKFRMRFIERPWMMDGKLPRYQWCDLTERMLYCNFEALVQFVENEKGHRMWHPDKDVKNLTPRERGLEYLDWEIDLVNDPNMGPDNMQSYGAREQKELYLWWKDIRPTRVDPYDNIIWEHPTKSRTELEDEQAEEDTEMLIRLMKIRRSLWT